MRTIVQDQTPQTPFDDDRLDDTVYGRPPDPQKEARVERERIEREIRTKRALYFQASGHTDEPTDDRERTEESESEAPEPDHGVSCEACTKRFRNEAALARHMTNFPVCGRWVEAADASIDRRLDMRSVHANPGVTGSFLADVLASAGGEDDASEPRTKCRSCGRAFSTTSALNRHLRNSIVCDRWRANAVLEKLAESARRVADGRRSDRDRGQVWESVRPELGRDVLARAGV
jgi:hypothetical protein